MSDSGTTTAAAAGGWLRERVSRRVAWLTDERRDAAGEPGTAPALVVLLGREHYVERRRRYPIASRRDLEAVLRQELSGAAPTLTLVSPVQDDRREVTFYELKPEVTAQVGRTVWLVPESLALAATLAPGEIATVARAGFRYFVAASGTSQPSGGALANAGLYALASGLDAGALTEVGEHGLRERLLTGLRRLPVDAWLRLRLASQRERAAIDWKPAVTLAGAALIGYLALASGYLMLTQHSRAKALDGLGSEVESLLVAQRDVDRMLAEQQGLAAVVAQRRSTYRLWQVASVAWSKGAEIASVELRDDKLIVRGNAPVATDVLGAVSVIPGVANARFSSPVRSGRQGREEFAISLDLGAEPGRG
jgi:hypothetical protein